MGGIQRHHLYDGEILIVKNEDRHTYQKNGEYVPSATAITRIIPKDLLKWAARMSAEAFYEKVAKAMPKQRQDTVFLKQALEEAKSAPFKYRDSRAIIGSEAHDWIHEFVKFRLQGVMNDQPAMPVNSEVANSVRGFLDWEKSHDIDWIFTERVVHSIEHNYCGTADLGAVIDNELYVIDFKTGKFVSRDAGVQTAAYAMALSEEFPKDIWGKQVVNRGVVHINTLDSKFDFYNDDRVREDLTGHNIDTDFGIFQVCKALYHWDKKNKYLWQTWKRRKK